MGNYLVPDLINVNSEEFGSNRFEKLGNALVMVTLKCKSIATIFD